MALDIPSENIKHNLTGHHSILAGARSLVPQGREAPFAPYRTIATQACIGVVAAKQPIPKPILVKMEARSK